MARCDFNSTELKDIEYIYSDYYNRLEIVRFSSSVGHFVGYTEYGVMQARAWNSGPELTDSKSRKETYCSNNIDVAYESALTRSGEFVHSDNRQTSEEMGREPGKRHHPTDKI